MAEDLHLTDLPPDYADSRGRALIDWDLYLPEDPWIADGERCAAAEIHSGAGFRTKPQLLQAMIERAIAAGVPFAWVTADEAYGDNGPLLRFLEQTARLRKGFGLRGPAGRCPPHARARATGMPAAFRHCRHPAGSPVGRRRRAGLGPRPGGHLRAHTDKATRGKPAPQPGQPHLQPIPARPAQSRRTRVLPAQRPLEDLSAHHGESKRNRRHRRRGSGPDPISRQPATRNSPRSPHCINSILGVPVPVAP
ncbi:DDE superfamily endonuclease [Sinosporangium album]|uniref:DDE superfamily endonuclease n=1 Tax=Sinosporangium album TaxID=504805 RepID=A0A1G7SIE4_9ACTN|nr:DDE superfamily endonuclease [Sinosporangium album]